MFKYTWENSTLQKKLTALKNTIKQFENYYCNISNISYGIATYNTNKATQAYSEHTQRIINNADELIKKSQELINNKRKQAQGHLFEIINTIKFNLNAYKKRGGVYAETTASTGKPHSTADIQIRENKKIVKNIQANEKYHGMDRLIPSDQLKKGKKLLDKRIESGTLKSSQYKDVKQNLTDELSHKDISSGKTTRKEAIKATTPNNAKKMASSYKREAIGKDIFYSSLKAAKIGAFWGAVSSGLPSLLKNINNVVKGKISAKKAIGNSIKDITIGATIGSLVQVLSITLNKTIKTFCPIPIVSFVGSFIGPIAGNYAHNTLSSWVNKNTQEATPPGLLMLPQSGDFILNNCVMLQNTHINKKRSKLQDDKSENASTFKTFDEFNKLMLDDKATILL